MYNITTVDRSANYEDSELNWLNSYNTNIATNTENLFKVNNTDKERKAATIRDHKKSLLQKKENIIDLKMQKLNTEISVLNTMIQGLKTVKNDNITRTFGGSA